MSEVPAFHFQGALLRAAGVVPVLHLTIATYVLRLACYYCLPW